MNSSCPNASFDSDPNVPELYKCIKRGKMIAFVGSGLSRGEGYPEWHSLVENMRVQCGISDQYAVNKETSANTLQDVAELAKNSDRDAYTKVLKDTFARSLTAIPSVYHALLNTSFISYCTTNYDPLLSLAITEWPGSKRITHAYPSLDYECLRKGDAVYLHGYIQQHQDPNPDTLVLSRADFDKAYHPDKSVLPQTWRNILYYHDIVFLGCRLKEPQLDKLFKQCCTLEESQDNDGNTKLHRRFILLQAEETETVPESGASDNVATAHRRRAEDAEYAKYGISVVRYDAKDNVHTGLAEVMREWPSAPKPVVFSRNPEEMNYDV